VSAGTRLISGYTSGCISGRMATVAPLSRWRDQNETPFNGRHPSAPSARPNQEDTSRLKHFLKIASVRAKPVAGLALREVL